MTDEIQLPWYTPVEPVAIDTPTAAFETAAPQQTPDQAVFGEETGPEGERGGRRWPTIVAVVIVVAAVGGALAVAVHQRSTAADWRDVAHHREQELASTNATLEARTKERDGATAERDQATARVTEVENQLAGVANEKAQLGDEREEFRKLIDIAPTINDALRKCAEANGDVATAVTGGEESISTLRSLIDRSEQVCAKADELASTLQGIVNGLTP